MTRGDPGAATLTADPVPAGANDAAGGDGRRPASLSLDLDNLWSYLKVRGDAGWLGFPSYLDAVVPRALGVLAGLGLRTTFFVVGQDAALAKNGGALRALAEAGHEIGNHSFRHEPWLHRYSAGEVDAEIERAEVAIEQATGVRPRGFRGPGYSLSETVLNALGRRGYAYDCSTFPTFVGPLARAYYFLRARLDDEERSRRSALFGDLRDGLRPLTTYRWDLPEGPLLEIPVTTFPVIRMPFHFSYIHWLAGFSETLAQSYFAAALRACDAAGVAPSLLMHPLDFLGRDDAAELSFFPGMDQSGERKTERMRRLLAKLSARYRVYAMADFAGVAAALSPPLRSPDFAAPRIEADRVAAAQAQGTLGVAQRAHRASRAQTMRRHPGTDSEIS